MGEVFTKRKIRNKKMKKLLIMTLALLNSVSFAKYDIVKRAKIMDDRFKTLEMLNPIGHDFFINIDAQLTKDITELQKFGEDVSKIDQSQTIENQIAEADEILEPFYDKEQVIRGNFRLGFPLPSFTVSKTKIKPNVRLGGGIFAMLTPSSSPISLTALIDNLSEVPEDYRERLKSCLTSLSNGDRILPTCRDNGDISTEEYNFIVAQYPGVEDIEYETSIATQSVDGPAIDVYAKFEAKAGLFNTYEYGENIFGDFNIYALARQDIQRNADALLLLTGGADFEYAENQRVNLALDYSLGYKNDNYRAKVAIEEVKMTEIQSDAAKLNWGDNMLIRLHAEADYKLSILTATPYLGSHAREGYGLGDAYYIGADFGAMAFEDRFGFLFKTQVDKEHYTLGLKARLWFLQLDLITKMAREEKIEGNKIADYYSGNLRIFF